MWQDCLHNEPPLSFLGGPRQDLLLLARVLLNHYLSIFVLDGLLLCERCLGVEGRLHRLLVVVRVLSALIEVGLKLGVGCLSAYVVVKAYVLAGLDFINAIVVEMTHHILLLRTNIVVIIRNISYHHFGFLHYIHCAWSLLLKEILALLRAD